jgi:hypothetical protein
MRILAVILLCFSFLPSAFCQIDQGGEPLSWSIPSLTQGLPVYRMNPVNLDRLSTEDAVQDRYKEAPFRFGDEQEVSIDFMTSSSSEIYKGKSIRRLSIASSGALSISLLFDRFQVPDGAELFIYNESKTELKGAFTSESNTSSKVFPVGLISGERIIIEYNGPDTGAELHISQLVHGYRGVLNKWEETRGPFGNSGACNININCSQGDAWQDQKRAVALIVQGGNALCTGALVNNTQQDGTPYFLTANHCLGTPGTWVYYFNHESSSCTGNSGPTNHSISGGTLLANNANSDFALIQLNQSPPASFQPFYAGWDKSDATNVTTAVGIHHPSGDVKKICFENNPPYHQQITATQVWWIDSWDSGVTEAGSSGSPLFNQAGRIIGQLFGGTAACTGSTNNGQSDYYGRFGVSWNGLNASLRLKDWLNPGNISISTLNGFGPFDIVYDLDAAQSGFEDIPSVICATGTISPKIRLRNNGVQVLSNVSVEYSYNNIAQETINWTGSLATGAQVLVELAPFQIQDGVNSIDLDFLNPNGMTDENPSNNGNLYTFQVENGVAGIGHIEVRLVTDQYAEETSWKIRDSNGTLIAQSGPLNNSQLNVKTVSVPLDACYDFTISDTYGDGICCEYGNGSYTLKDFYGATLATGSEFEFSESHIISITDSYLGIPPPPIPELAFQVGPNPTFENLNVYFNRDSITTSIRIYDVLGRVELEEYFLNQGAISVNVAHLNYGLYFVEFTGEGFRQVLKMLKN